jgi:hypothetical protein
MARKMLVFEATGNLNAATDLHEEIISSKYK